VIRDLKKLRPVPTISKVGLPGGQKRDARGPNFKKNPVILS
jgi:hypothetical protein